MWTLRRYFFHLKSAGRDVLCVKMILANRASTLYTSPPMCPTQYYCFTDKGSKVNNNQINTYNKHCFQTVAKSDLIFEAHPPSWFFHVTGVLLQTYQWLSKQRWVQQWHLEPWKSFLFKTCWAHCVGCHLLYLSQYGTTNTWNLILPQIHVRGLDLYQKNHLIICFKPDLTSERMSLTCLNVKLANI